MVANENVCFKLDIKNQFTNTLSIPNFYLLKQEFFCLFCFLEILVLFEYFLFVCRSAADEVVSGKGKFEEVMVASREIAASSMQLVMASKVKADRTSQNMAALSKASKTISTLTGTVVATAENCRDKVKEQSKFFIKIH